MLLTPLPMSGRGDTIQQQQSLWSQGRTWGLVGTPLTMKNCVFPIKTAPRPASLCDMPTAQPRASSGGWGSWEVSRAVCLPHVSSQAKQMYRKQPCKDAQNLL